MDGNISLENALNATNAMSLKPLKKPNVVDLPGGAVLPSDLPLVSLQDHGRARHVFDIVGMVNLNKGLKKDLANKAAFMTFLPHLDSKSLLAPFVSSICPRTLYQSGRGSPTS